MKFSRDEIAENALNNAGHKFEINEYELSEFDLRAGLDNNARIVALNQDRLVEYERFNEKGAVWPAVIAYRNSETGQLVVLAGNHRLEICRRTGGGEVLCIEIAEDDIRARQFVLAFDNERHGLSTSTVERNARIIAYHEAVPHAPLREIADACNVDKTTVGSAIKEHQTREFLEARSISCDNLKPAHAAEIVKMRAMSDDIAARVAEKSLDTLTTKADLSELRKGLHALPNEKTRLQAIEEWIPVSDGNDRIIKNSAGAARTRSLSIIRQMENWAIRHPSIIHAGFAEGEEKKAMVKRLRELAKILREIASA